MQFDVVIQYLPRLLEGAVTTLELVLISGIIGSLLALPIGLARHSHRRWLNALPYAYIFFFRGTPLLVQIFLVYYGLAQFDAVRESALWPYLREPYWCAIIAFSLNTAAYTAEILRGALGAIPKGEIEAAKTIGMRQPMLYRRIMLPRAFGMILPAYGNEVILMLKGSALASTITLLDLTGMARTIIARTYTPIEIFLAAGAIYLLISVGIIMVFRQLEKRHNRHLQPLTVKVSAKPASS
ncbi:ABC transporter permease [Marinobacterium arenosum]|uniref:ABC transporter permease n=1 Tax=Marinobacterium arenosum TaxID=2862496 RepID=UPI001C945911|nr:ABC transporter permease [Marinobacterium arenosum]MBY4675387.1 ABC transporter permease [Marinobacterium arenosum]